MKNFKQLRIWQKGMEIAAQTFKLAATLPKEERYGLAVQMTKAAVSIPSNIAEGSGRSSAKENGRFLEIALGSSFELETQVLIAEAMNLGDQAIRMTLLLDLDEEQKMLISFCRVLKAS